MSRAKVCGYELHDKGRYPTGVSRLDLI